MMRTHTCGELRENDEGKIVVLSGWIKRIREYSKIVFIDLWDRYGMTQVVIDKTLIGDKKIKKESVVQVKGKVRLRESPNPNIKTGKIEVDAEEFNVLSLSEQLPMEIGDPNNTDYTRLKYRFLDMRRDEMQYNIYMRYKITHEISKYFDSQNFIAVETPILAKSTPEGARDYLVPSRINKGKFYALPQSPQLFKQLLMVAGFDRYYQVARCFRDEDLRADRQPEFTQIDMEMSFVDEEDIMAIVEGMMKHVFKNVLNIEIDTPFKRMTYDDAMSLYGSDKPDLRYDLKLNDITEICKGSSFKVLSDAEMVKCIRLPVNVRDVVFSRKDIDKFAEEIKPFGAKGVIYLRFGHEGLEGPMAKHIEDSTKDKLISKFDMQEGDSLFIISGDKKVVERSLGELRRRLASHLNLADDDKFEFVWIVDFPMFEYNDDEKRYVAVHHPFTQPKIKDYDELKDKENCKARAYDIVLNGEELGGGSIRINTVEMQEKVFKEIGLDMEKARQRFGFLLDAFKYGAPPHGGIALGLDRMIAIMLKIKDHDIRETIAFPKMKNAEDPMLEAPSEVDSEQLDELGLGLKLS